MGCLKAFAKTTWTKKFYDLERLKFNGVNAQWDLGFDETKVLNAEQIAQLKRDRPDLAADVDYQGASKPRARCRSRSWPAAAATSSLPTRRATAALVER